VNKTEGPKFVPMKQSKDLRLHRDLSTKLIKKKQLTFNGSWVAV